MMHMKAGMVYWTEGRTFIHGKTGRKFHTGLVIEADGMHLARIPAREDLRPVQYRGSDYPTRKVRGWLRKMKPATKGARKLMKELLA